MKISDWIQISGIVVSTLVAITSIFIALKSLRLTRKSIEEANRPYVTCFAYAIDTGFQAKYFVIKNFGNSGAQIINIEFSKNLPEIGRNGTINSVINSLIAPNQKFMTAVPSEMNDIVDVKITYKDSSNNLFIESHTINFGYSQDLFYTTVKHSHLSDTANTMQNVTQSIIKHFV
ncbi:hypothetical protein [Bacillus thuringiensis]|uniref:Uncharacterized protein n=1 Tax=Bacillus thuringiensis subsp. higo TaxID=132266 RepID=A0A9X6LC16_BACUH|nr:hypothetical protein [Bacillus thuringiensis]OUB41435.1 hypothetical protein BK716_29535 [Bacillus thuringiensis serovar higo]OUB61229.1 hypothetical protein BK716_01615 [Bacillus thuringiensis serovar higo]